jgi:DNA-directed RNA polymerase specialized sigma subunit
MAYALSHQVTLLPWPQDVILHSCDNPPCCNPRHLIKGTQADNIEDMVTKARHARDVSPAYKASRRSSGLARKTIPRGEVNGFAKLTDAEVAVIRRLYSKGARQVDLAARFGVGQSHISRIVRREAR